METFDSCEPRAPDTRGWSAKTGLVFVALLHRVRPKAGSVKTAPSEEERTADTLSAGARGNLERYRRRGPGPAWPRSRGVTRAPFGKMLRHPISKRRKTCRHPSDFVEIAVGLRSRTLRPASHTFGWTARWTPLRSSLPSPPFMVSTKDMTREARLERSPALRFAPS
jgi:hypothetical protein